MNLIHKRLTQSYYTFTHFLGKKKEDIYLVSYPKSGNTWVKFVLLNVLKNNREIGKNISFKLLDETMPELGWNNILVKWPFKSLPRFIKSHLPYHKFFFGTNRALLIVRNPKDVMVSFFHYAKSIKAYNFNGTFQEFIRSEKFGIEQCILHQISWQDKASVCIKFEDLKKSNGLNLLQALQKLGVAVNSDIFHKAFEDASFNKMRQLDNTPKKNNAFALNINFARNGSSNQWIDYFEEDDLKYYESILKKYSNEYINYYAAE